MLVLSRKPSERILIGEDITLTVVRIGPNTVRLGIDAPGHLNIVREELSEGFTRQSEGQRQADDQADDTRGAA